MVSRTSSKVTPLPAEMSSWSMPELPALLSRRPSDAQSACPGIEPEEEEEDDQLQKQKMQEIKARTMYEMVEEIELPGGPCKLLFLTNVQAALIAQTDENLQKMLDALEVPKPQLIINLLLSQGFSGNTTTYEGSVAEDAVVNNRAPFLTPQEERPTSASTPSWRRSSSPSRRRPTRSSSRIRPNTAS